MLRFYDPPPFGGPLRGSRLFKRPELGHSPTYSGGWVSDTPKKRGLPGCRDLPASQGSCRAKGQGPFRTFRASDFAGPRNLGNRRVSSRTACTSPGASQTPQGRRSAAIPDRPSFQICRRPPDLIPHLSS